MTTTTDTPESVCETSALTRPHRRIIAAWLYFVTAVIFAMVVVGGITRLTNSGLSMVEWRPLMGAVPPLNEAQWQETFDQYKQFPEYRHRGPEMTLHEFKFIFFWEYVHRLLGRTIGVIFFIPMVFFWVKGWLDRSLKWKLATAFILGGLQGVLGWYMVVSGLIDEPRVSHYRLAAHLSLALFLMVYVFWIALGLTFPDREKPATNHRRLHRFAWLIMAVLIVQIIYGAFTAGLDAGLMFNTFPSMNGYWIPDDMMYMPSLIGNLTANSIVVQFIHRNIAWLLVILIVSFFLSAKQTSGLSKQQRMATHLLLGTLFLQFVLGVLTLLKAVPVGLGSMHQAGACLLLLVLTSVIFSLKARSY